MITDELIANAYYLSNKVSRGLETVAGDELADGLRMLNDILSEKSMSGRYIPYHSHSSLSTVVGQEEYNIPGLILVDAITFNIGDVRYSMSRLQRNNYFGSSRVDNINSLPYSYHVERTKGGSNLYLYFEPVDIYEVKITGKFELSSVTADDTISDTLDQFYISYLTYALAKRICDFNSLEFSAQKLMTLRELEDQLTDVSPQDFRVLKRSTLSSRTGGYNWGDVNIGRGWRP